MKKWIFIGLALIVFSACFVSAKEKQSKPANIKYPVLLAVDFNTAVPLKYKFVADRQISLNLDPEGKYSKERGDEGKVQKMADKLEMEIVYKAVKIDPNGCSTVEATCNSAKVTRTSPEGREQTKPDAVESFVGKSFTLKITPSGKVADYSSFNSLLAALNNVAFGGDSKKFRIKDPDMIMDLVATQWRIWDSIASIKKPLKGVKKNSTWNSQLLAPMPFVSKTGRDVVYKLAGGDINDVSCVDITSTYTLSKLQATDAPWPYGNSSFQMRGVFGFLQGYKVLSLTGTGQQLFDIKRGLIKSDTQHFNSKVSASIMGLGANALEPNINVDQTITMTLVE
jgi:hypothetical protein